MKQGVQEVPCLYFWIARLDEWYALERVARLRGAKIYTLRLPYQRSARQLTAMAKRERTMELGQWLGLQKKQRAQAATLRRALAKEAKRKAAEVDEWLKTK